MDSNEIFENKVISPGSSKWDELPSKMKLKLVNQYGMYNIDAVASIQRWHLWHMCTARFYGLKSKCLSHKIGAVIVRDKTVLATGYNGPPRGVAECHTQARLEHVISNHLDPKDIDAISHLTAHWGEGCPRRILGFRSGEGLHLCPAGHAESNSIANAAREGVRVSGADMYTYPLMPCMFCAKQIIGAGIARVFHVKGDDYDKEARWMMEQAGIKLIGVPKEMIGNLWNTLLHSKTECGSCMAHQCSSKSSNQTSEE